MRNKGIENLNEPTYHIIRELKNHGEYTTFTGFIDDKIQQYQNHRDNRYTKGRFTRADIASKMDKFDKDTLKRILNGNQRTRKRDLLIAVFAVLKLSVSETNMGLELYQMAPLNPNRPRDLVIQQAISSEKGFEGLNEMLVECKCSPLNLRREDKKKRDEDGSFYYKKATPSYEVITKRVIPYHTVPVSGLSSRYYPGNYQFYVYYIIKDLSNGRVLKLEDPYYQNVYLLDENGNQGEFPLYSKGILRKASVYGERCTDPEIIQYFLSMEYLEQVKAKELLMILDDTRNYGIRTTAYFRNGEIVLFSEAFNQEFPELSEYYQVEVSSSFQKLSVSSKSIFLVKDIGEQRYYEIYGRQACEILDHFNSLSELIDEQCKTAIQEKKLRLEHYYKWFSRAFKACEEAYQKLKNKEVNIYEIKETESLTDLIDEYQIYDELECVPSDDGCFSIPGKDSFQTDDGITIDLETIIRAAELGIPSVSEISHIIRIKGSVEAILSEPLKK